MHARAIVGPPGIMPHLNPRSGMPRLRRTIPRPVSNPFPMGTGGRGIGPAYYAATGELPPWCPYRDVAGNPACHAEIVSPAPAGAGSASVGACFPKFDPIKQYGVGLPPPAPNMGPSPMRHQPGIDPRTGMPRLRSPIWYR